MTYQWQTVDRTGARRSVFPEPDDTEAAATGRADGVPCGAATFATATRNVQNNEHITHPLESARKR